MTPGGIRGRGRRTDTRHFLHITSLAAMDPASLAGDRAHVGVGPDTPEDTVILSNFMRAEIAPGGPRFDDFAALLEMKPTELRAAAGLRVCAH